MTAEKRASSRKRVPYGRAPAGKRFLFKLPDFLMNLCSSYAKFSELALNQPTPPKPKPNGYVLKLYHKQNPAGRISDTTRAYRRDNKSVSTDQ